MIVFQIAVGLTMGAIAYYGIIQTKSVSTKYLVGYGVIIPAMLYLPFPFIEFFDVRAICLRMGLIAAPLTVTLKCLEPMYGFIPDYVTWSLRDFVIHFGFIQYARVDSKTKR